jgi:hypothetical protein
MTFLTPRRRARRPIGSIAALSAGGLAAGAVAWWFLDPRRGAEHRRNAQEKLRTASTQVSGKTRELGSKAAEAARTYQARASEGARSLSERARGAADEVRSTASEGAAKLEASGVPRDRTLTGTAAAILVVRAAMGGGLLRVPMALAGATLLSRVAGQSETLRRGVSRTRDAARSAADRLHDVGAAQGGERQPQGAGRRRPEVREAKSPGELEPGVASGRPDPTFKDRVDRSGPHMGGGGGRGRGGWQAGAADEDRGGEAGLGAPGTDDVVGGRAGFDSPEPGAGVREEDLGVVAPRDESRPEEEETPRIFGPGEGEAPRSAGGPEGLDQVSPLVTAPGDAGTEGTASPRIVGPDERPVGSGVGLEETPAPRIAGADEDPATRRTAGEADAARKDPTSDGG